MTDSEIAESLYVATLSSGDAVKYWDETVLASRKRVFTALRDSNFLFEIEEALQYSGANLTVFRHMLGPPVSQDQFALICPAYRKSWEKPGRSVGVTESAAVASIIRNLLDRRLTRWLNEARRPTTREARLVASIVPSLMSIQAVATVRRNRISAMQENAVVDLLRSMGWSKLSSGLIEQSVSLPNNHFMHKTKFATKTRPQEVDIACGLGNSVVLAMECKVTNDKTNSVKRINDILKKATAWQDHWGSFVKTAALLQGVIAEKDVQRLHAANVHVFWSHDLPKFRNWLEANSI